MSSVFKVTEHRVLIVEDDETIRSFLHQTLEQNGIPATVAENGARAIEIASRGGISLLTIDYSLPDMTGDELVRSLRKSGVDLPFIMITGMGNEEVAISSMKLGARDYLVKNDNLFDRVPKVVSGILDKLRSEEQLSAVRAALLESEERFSKVFQNSNDGVMLLNEDLSILDVNKQALLSLGYEQVEEISKLNSKTIISPDIESALKDFLLGRKENPVYRFEAIFQHKNRGYFVADSVLTSFKANSREFILLNFRDISERLQNLELIEKAAEDWRNTFDSISDLVSVHDCDMRFVNVNKAYANFVGLPISEIIGQKCHELLHPNGITFDSCPHKNTITQGAVVTEEVFHADVGIPLLVTTSPIFNDLGEITGSVHIAKDISELKKAHEKVEDSERFLRDVLDSIQDGITILDTEFRIVRTNSFLEKKYASRVPLKGKHCYDVFQNREEPCKVCPSRRTFETKEPASDILSFKTPHKKVCGWMEVFTYPLIDNKSGEVQGVIEYMRDITQRLQAETDLKESEEKYRSLFDDANDAIIVANAETGIITECNTAAEKLTGRSKEELIGLHQRELHPPETRQAKEFTESFAQQRILPDGEAIQAKILRKDNTIRDVSIKASRIAYHDETFLLGVFRDITERKLINERVKQAQKLESIGTLAGGIAHDFNNILTAVIGFAEIVKTDLLSGEQPVVEDIEGIIEAGHRASELVRQVLTFSRQSSMERACIDVTPIVKETVRFLKASLPSTIQIDAKFNIFSSRLYADPVQVHQVVMNLCTNAHHAMRQSGGTLSIILDEVDISDECLGDDHKVAPGKYVRISVSDTGHGMDEITLGRIFDPYFSTKSRDEGTGLGLSVVHGIVQKHGGKITVYSNIGAGTTFRVYLPVVQSNDESKERVDDADFLLTGNERILLVDDEKNIVKTGKRMLSRLGYDVTGCTDSEQCMEMFRSAPDRFDMVITDLTMPKMTGLDLAREIKLISPNTPVILLTGFSSFKDEDKLLELGIDCLIKKPVLKSEIARAVRSVLDSASKERDRAEID